MRQRARSPDAGRSHRPSAGCTLRIDEGPGHCHCVAQEVAAGFPVGDPMTLTRGAVSGLGRIRPPPAAELGRQHRLRGRCTMHQPDGSTGTGSDAHPARIPPRHHASGRTGVEEPAHLASWARSPQGSKSPPAVRRAPAPPATATATWPGSWARPPSGPAGPIRSGRTLPAHRPTPRQEESRRRGRPFHPGDRLVPATRRGAQFHDLGVDHYDSRINPDRKKRNHIRELEVLGYRVTLQPAA